MTEHRLILSPSRCGDSSTCWRGSCSCGAWTKGPHFMADTVRAYWHDHKYLAGIDETEAHVLALIAEAETPTTDRTDS